jgi:glycosyltransferase involved in cell wall biosynthesis
LKKTWFKLNDKLHILALSSWFPTSDNPQLGNFITRHLTVFSKKYRITWLIIEGTQTQQERKHVSNPSDSFEIIRISYPKKNKLSNLLRERKILRETVSNLSPIQLVLGNVVFPKGLQFLWAKKMCKCPLVIIEHSATYRNEESTSWNFLQRVMHKKVLLEADHVLSVSELLRTEIGTLFPVKHSSVLPNVVENVFYETSTAQRTPKLQFIHISNLDESYKNVLGIFESFEALLTLGYEANLVLVTDLDSPEHTKWIKDKGLEAKIRFVGPLEAKEIHELLCVSTAYIHNSRYETFSCVLAESLASGIPIISTPVGIAREFDSCIFLKIDEQHSMLERMVEVAENKHLIDEKAQRVWSMKYHEKQVLQKFEELVRSLTLKENA